MSRNHQKKFKMSRRSLFESTTSAQGPTQLEPIQKRAQVECLQLFFASPHEAVFLLSAVLAQNRKNPHAHKNQIGTSTPPPSKKTQNPPLKGGISWAWGFSCRKNQKMPGAHIKLAQPFPAQNYGRKFYGHHVFFF